MPAYNQNQVITLPDSIYDLFVMSVAPEKADTFLNRKLNNDLTLVGDLGMATLAKSKELGVPDGVVKWDILSLNNAYSFIFEPCEKTHFNISDENHPEGCLVDERVFGVVSTILAFRELADKYKNEPSTTAMFSKYALDTKTELIDLIQHVLTNEPHLVSEQEKTQAENVIKTVNAFII